MPPLVDLVRPRLGTVLAALCVTEIVSWGLLYYAFPVLAPRISADTGWSPVAVTSAFSAALVVSALSGVLVGRVIDRHEPRRVMAGVLYPSAFAAITGWFTERRLGALTTLTLVAGLASTVFAPLTAAAGAHFGWRATYLWAAAVLAVLTLPAHWFLLRRPWSRSCSSAASTPRPPRGCSASEVTAPETA